MKGAAIIPFVPEVELSFIGGVYFHKMTFPANMRGLKETHEFDHASICARGSGHLIVGGERVPFKAGDLITVKAGVEHSVMTYAETVWICVHSEEVG